MKKSIEKHYCSTLAFILFIVLILPKDKSFGQTEELPPNSHSIIPAMNFKDSDIRDVLGSIAFEYETNIVIDNEVNARISVSLFKISVFDAIEIIALDNNYKFDYNDQRFFVSIIKEEEPEKPEPPPKKVPVINYLDKKLTLELESVDLKILVNKLRKVTNKNYLLTRGTGGTITGSLKDVDLETGLKSILRNNGYHLSTKDSIYYISRSASFSSIESINDLSNRPYWVSAMNNSVTIDVTSANLADVLNDLTNQLGLQVIKLIEPSVNVTIKCKDVPLTTALNYLFRGTEYTYKKEDGVYIFGDKKSNQLNDTKLVYLNYLRADEINENIPAILLQNVNASVSIEHNGIVLTGAKENILAVERYIKTIDQPVPQVMIEALVVDYNLDDIYKFGLYAGIGDSATLSRPDKWYPSLDVTASGKKINQILKGIGSINLFGNELNIASLGVLPDDFYVNIQAMDQMGIANIKSRPILSTINGHTASLKIGTVQYYVFKEIVPIVNSVNSTFIEKERIEKIEANISFEITPWVGQNGELTLEIKPTFETPVGQFSPDKNLIPAINTRSFVSTVRLRDGETVVLGGIIQETEIITENKFPILGDIPLIGELFRNVEKRKSKGELMIYLTPHIYYGRDISELNNNSD